MITINFGPDELRSTDFVGPIIIEDVYIGVEGAEPVVNIRISEDASDEEWPGEKPYFYVLEYEIKCSNLISTGPEGVAQCGASNWIHFGTDPGEYRCVKCTNWL
jgi:hypothetical protein